MREGIRGIAGRRLQSDRQSARSAASVDDNGDGSVPRRSGRTQQATLMSTSGEESPTD